MTTRSALPVEGFFDPTTWTVSDIVLEQGSLHCALIDSVLDDDPKSGRTAHASADRLIACVRALGTNVQWMLESHVHADHLSAAPYLKQALGGQRGIGRHISTVQQVFGNMVNAGTGLARDGRQFDHLFADGETFWIGGLQARALHTPSHTPACMTHAVDHPAQDPGPLAAFVGDTLFMPDDGTARCGLPSGDARTLFRSINKELSLPPQTQRYMCHGHQPGGRALQYVSTVAAQRKKNVHVRNGISEDPFVAMRHARDATLAMPTPGLPAAQVNRRAGQLPEPESNGTRDIDSLEHGLSADLPMDKPSRTGAQPMVQPAIRRLHVDERLPIANASALESMVAIGQRLRDAGVALRVSEVKGSVKGRVISPVTRPILGRPTTMPAVQRRSGRVGLTHVQAVSALAAATDV